MSRPFRAEIFDNGPPRALPWAGMSRPFGADGRGDERYTLAREGLDHNSGHPSSRQPVAAGGRSYAVGAAPGRDECQPRTGRINDQGPRQAKASG